MKVRLLLLQARRVDDPMRSHELECFVDRTGLEPDRVVPHNLCEGIPPISRVRQADALVIGGSGDFYVSKGNLPGSDALEDLLREVVDVGHPTFASCFGYQSLVAALGGEVIHDPDKTEVGTYELELTPKGADDALFGALPTRFKAQMGHKDRASRHPEGWSNLASSELSPLQGLRVPDRPIWATQFHPELTRKTNADRFRHYLAGYAAYMSPEERQQTLERFDESHEASDLLRRFLEVVF